MASGSPLCKLQSFVQAIVNAGGRRLTLDPLPLLQDCQSNARLAWFVTGCGAMRLKGKPKSNFAPAENRSHQNSISRAEANKDGAARCVITPGGAAFAAQSLYSKFPTLMNPPPPIQHFNPAKQRGTAGLRDAPSPLRLPATAAAVSATFLQVLPNLPPAPPACLQRGSETPLAGLEPGRAEPSRPGPWSRGKTTHGTEPRRTVGPSRHRGGAVWRRQRGRVGANTNTTVVVQ